MLANGRWMAAVFLLLSSGGLRADSWRLPQRKSYYSANKRFRLDVVPKTLSSPLHYFEDKLANEGNAGASDKSGPATASGVFLSRGRFGRFVKRHAFPLRNEVAPLNALVSDEGTRLVTFDNWHSVGHGDEVVVLYRASGELLAKFSLLDLLTEEDIGTLTRSVSSIWWGGQHSIEGQQLILRVVARESQPGTRTRELRIDLETGKPLAPKHHLFPELHGGNEATLTLRPTSEVLPTDLAGFQCSAAGKAHSNALEHQLASDVTARSLRLPAFAAYPPLARQARIQGVVSADILFDAAGNVTCVRVRSGHPLLRGSAFGILLGSHLERSSVPEGWSAFSSATLVEFSLGISGTP